MFNKVPYRTYKKDINLPVQVSLDASITVVSCVKKVGSGTRGLQSLCFRIGSDWLDYSIVVAFQFSVLKQQNCKIKENPSPYYAPSTYHLPIRMRSSRVVRASDSQCRKRNCPEFDPSILRHVGICWAADEAMLNKVLVPLVSLCSTCQREKV